MANYRLVSRKRKKTVAPDNGARREESANDVRRAATASDVRRETMANGVPRETTASAARRYAGAKDVNLKTSEKSTKRMSRAKKAAIIVSAVIVVLAAAFFSLGFYVRGLDTIFPNVWADGVDLSGMTFEEARQMLVDMGYESDADGVSATIVFPDDSSFSVFGDAAGLSLNAEEAAQAAFEYGRDGSFFENKLTFIRSLFTDTELSDVSTAKFDEEYVRDAAEAHVKTFNDKLISDAVDINDDAIIIVKGITFSPADENAVHVLAVATLMKAMAEKAHLTAEYDPEVTVAQEIDLHTLYNSISVEAISAVYDPDTFSATESYPGVSFDMDAARIKIDSAGMGERVVIPLIAIEPEITTEDIESKLFRDVLAETTTSTAGSSSNRINNIVLSSSAINGKQMNPGDMFSFNEVVGQRTAERGYLPAGAYVGELVVQETGGGICQTSSTLYYSVLKADLDVVERRPHTMTVGYLPFGGDATIDWGNIDFKFKNSTEYPIRIETEMSENNRNVTMRLIGTKQDDNYIQLEHIIMSSTPVEIVMREDESILPGETKVLTEGSTGYVVDTFKHLFDSDDNLISTTQVGRSVYFVQNRIILIPPESEEDPDDPEDLEDPDDPEDPGDPAGPGDTEDPDGSTDPEDPYDPYDPYDPEEPYDPYSPEYPGGSV